MSSELELLATNPDTLALADDPTRYVVLACERAKTWLTQALEHGDIDQIVELKSQAEAIRVYTAQKEIGKDAELAAAEIVRRAERGIGLAIRKGQENGVIAKRGDIGAAAPPLGGKPGAPPVVDGVRGADLHRPTEYVAIDDLKNAAYPLASVPDEQYEVALKEARAEGNLSRANVLRKIRGETPKSDRPEVLRGTRRLDPARVIRETVTALEGLCIGLRLLEREQGHFNALDPNDVAEWSSSLAKSRQELSRLQKELDRVRS